VPNDSHDLHARLTLLDRRLDHIPYGERISLEWWLIDGRWQRRGRGGDKLCMRRLGDQGPYADWNVYAATFPRV
jgi:hypothetical protein